LTVRTRWIVGLSGLALLLGAAGLVMVDLHGDRLLIRLSDPVYLQRQLQAWGPLAPLVFVAVQALQVVVAPIPGEVTGFLGGYVFGQWWGFLYSMLGLTAGSLLAFGVGRWLGISVVQRAVSPEVWHRLGFIVEAEGAILCFLVFLIPGFPKDMTCYLFGLSPMPFWVFALVQTLGRVPGTWVLSAQGARTATGHYIEVAFLTALVAAIAIPLYYYRHRILARLRARRGKATEDAREP
jgi:uncharacterized membrane protein YdjX (TVP38/TMEM64 family)